MTLLDRKLWRDVASLRGQVASIALVVAAGVAVFIAMISAYNSLRAARDDFYDNARFPQIFAKVKRAPLSLMPQLVAIPGVAVVAPRIVRDVVIDMPTASLPVSARLISLSRGGDEALARLYLRSGSAPAPNDARAAAVNEAFAAANRVVPGQSLRVILNGRVQQFRIEGVALSPEYVYAVKPGVAIPDDRFFAVLWVDRSAAEAAFDMKGAFNDLVVSLAPGAPTKPVIAELDRLLEPYGSAGAVDRHDQPSNRFLEDELTQQKLTSITIPLIFFGIAAFLLNVTLSRQVAAQREQIATLKALGFPTAPLVAHYLKLAGIIVVLGSGLGVLGGFGIGRAMIASYRGFFTFPSMQFALAPWSVMAGIGVSFAAAFLGVATAVRSVAMTAPAVAMRPRAPGRFRHSWLGRLPPFARVRSSHLMVLRNITGRPLRASLTVLTTALAVPMVILGLFWRDAIDRMIEVQFARVERGNATITFPHALDRRIIHDLAREPGVLVAEGERIVPVRLRAGHRSYLTSVVGIPSRAELRRPHDAALRPIEVSPEGITLNRRLAERLGVSPGQIMTIEVMEGRQLKRDLPVSALVDETIGMGSYMEIAALNRLTGEGDVVSAATLFVEPTMLIRLVRRLKELAVVESATLKAFTLASFLEKIAYLVLVSAGILTGFAVIIAGGIVYTGARISLQERAWELAGLRVLGFTRAEVASILFGEFTIYILLAVPIGIALSQRIIDAIARLHSNESFEIPSVIDFRTFAAAAIIVVLAAALSANLVRRRVDRLDLVAALKTRE